MAKLQFTVPDMACSACADTITKAVHGVDAGASVSADPSTKIVVVETEASDTTVKEAIATAGYTIA